MIDNNNKYLSDLIEGYYLIDRDDAKKFKSNALKELKSTSPEQNELVSEFLVCYENLSQIYNEKLKQFDSNSKEFPAGWCFIKLCGTIGSAIGGFCLRDYLIGQGIDSLVSTISGISLFGSGTILANYLPTKIILNSFQKDVQRLINAYASRMDSIDLITLDKQVNEQFLLLEKRKKKDLKC